MADSEFDLMQCSPSEGAESSKTPDGIQRKSNVVYQAAYQKFIKWCDEQNVTDYSETVLLGYFSQLETKIKMKCSTMWSQYSMIKSLLIRKHGVDISKYLKLRAYLKKQNEGYTPRKSRGFRKQQVERFLVEAPDDKYLGMKTVLVVGISGACRCEEMVKLTFDSVEDFGSLIHIKIPDSKTNKKRFFTIVNESYINILRKYVALRPGGMTERRFFLQYNNGKCHRLVMGIHKISCVPREVASYLKLPNWKEYTGHCLRRTSATLLED